MKKIQIEIELQRIAIENGVDPLYTYEAPEKVAAMLLPLLRDNEQNERKFCQDVISEFS
jgi:hypothetical protein